MGTYRLGWATTGEVEQDNLVRTVWLTYSLLPEADRTTYMCGTSEYIRVPVWTPVLIVPVEGKEEADHVMPEALHIEATTILQARPTLVRVGGDSEAPREAPVLMSILPETRIAADSGTKPMRAKSTTTTDDPVVVGSSEATQKAWFQSQ